MSIIFTDEQKLEQDLYVAKLYVDRIKDKALIRAMKCQQLDITKPEDGSPCKSLKMYGQWKAVSTPFTKPGNHRIDRSRFMTVECSCAKPARFDIRMDLIDSLEQRNCAYYHDGLDKSRKLTPADVYDIYKDERTAKEIAAHYSVSAGTIRRLKMGDIWKKQYRIHYGDQ